MFVRSAPNAQLMLGLSCNSLKQISLQYKCRKCLEDLSAASMDRTKLCFHHRLRKKSLISEYKIQPSKSGIRIWHDFRSAVHQISLSLGLCCENAHGVSPSHTYISFYSAFIYFSTISQKKATIFPGEKSKQKLEFYVVVSIMQTRWLPHICRTETSNTLTNIVTPPLSGKFKHRLVLTTFLQRSGNWKQILQLFAFDAVRKALRNPGSTPSADH